MLLVLHYRIDSPTKLHAIVIGNLTSLVIATVMTSGWFSNCKYDLWEGVTGGGLNDLLRGEIGFDFIVFFGAVVRFKIGDF